MDPAVDPFHPLIRLVDRYRREVNALQPGASEDAVRAAERHLGHRLPLTLAGFLRRWNGATLFRGALVLRGTSELACPNESFPGLVAFADSPTGRQWVYAPNGQGAFIFGELGEHGLIPLHDRYDRWLNGTIRLFDEDRFGKADEIELRREVDPECGHLLLAMGDAALRLGDPAVAHSRYQRAVSADPGNIRAWQRLGEMHLGEGSRGQAQFSLLKAMRATRLPMPFAGASVLHSEALQTLSTLFPQGDAGWQRELEDLLGERISDIRTQEGLELYERVALQLGRVVLDQGQRREARNVYVQALERSRAFARRGPLVDLTLALVAVETQLGAHDAAEKRLRPLLRSDDPHAHARANLALGRIVVMRQEPWAEEILRGAWGGLRRVEDRATLRLVEGESHLLHQQLDDAEMALREADALSVEGGLLCLQGAVCVGLGDVARLRGDLEGAETAYRAARDRAEESHDKELFSRTLLRFGDLARAHGDTETALACYRKAVEGYAALDLPIRGAWAQLRLFRVGAPEAEDALRRAREVFVDPAIQLTAGVGAVDALAGQPGASILWHMERCSAHERHRHEAQRARPPLTRADADRPERRIASHRMAISAAGKGVVDALRNELLQRGRELEGAQARSTDPNVAAYIAAVDLLAWHRSYEGAETLLDQLFNRRLPELPARALKGAVTRSPNAALVDGLLQAVEDAKEPRGTAAAAEVLGWRREVAAVPAIEALALSQRTWRVRRAAVVALGRIGERSSVPTLLEVLDVPELAEAVAIALLLLGDRRGVDFHGQALASGAELANPPGEIVGRYGGPSYLLLLLGTATGEGPKGLSALQGLGYLGDTRAVPRLMGALGQRDRTRVAVACGSLELITGHREDPEEPGVHARYERWWEENGSRFQDGVRYRSGAPLHPGVLAASLSHDDRLVRRSAYDELVITSGVCLPFDADGPYRVQQAHQLAWLRWARDNAGKFQPGRWMFDGGAIG